MKKTDLDKYEAKLNEEKTSLVNDLKDIATFNTETSQWEALPSKQDGPESDMIDLADRLEDFESQSETVKSLSKRLSNIDLALDKIKNGGFGICEISGEKIEPERLDANPAARTCKAHINNSI